MIWQVKMWHGYSDSLYDDLYKLVGCRFDTTEDDQSCMYFDGSLDIFVARWKRPVLIYPRDDLIAVSQFNNFNQR